MLVLRSVVFLSVLFCGAVQADIPKRIDKDRANSAVKQAAAQAETSRRDANTKQASLRDRTTTRTAAESERDAAASVVNEIKGHQDRIVKNETTRTGLKTNLDRLSAEIRTAEGIKKNAANASADAANESLAAKEAARAISSSLSTDTQELTRIRTELENAKAKLRELAAETNALDTDQTLLSTQKQTYDDELNGIAARINSLQDSLRLARKQASDSDTEYQSARKTRDNAQIDLEEAKKGVADFDRQLVQVAKEIETLALGEKQLTKKRDDAKTATQAQNRALQTLDIEKQKYDDTLPLLVSELTNSRDELQATRTALATIEGLIKDATDKAPLEQRKKELQDQETELTQRVAKQQAEVKTMRQAALDVPGKRADIKIKLLEFEQTAKEAQADLDASSQQAIVLTGRRHDLQTKKQTCQKDCDRLNNQLPGFENRVTQTEKPTLAVRRQIEQIEEQIEHLGNRRPYLDRMILAANAALRILSTEAIPNNDQTTQDATDLRNKLANDERILAARVADFEFQKKQADVRVSEADRILNLRKGDLQTAETALASLVAEQSRDQKNYSGLEAENQSLQGTIRLREGAIAAKSGGLTPIAWLELQKKKVDEAITLEQIAAAAFGSADKIASTAEAALVAANKELVDCTTAYNSEKGTIEKSAIADARSHGTREGKERGALDGGPAGKKAGEKLGIEEGSSLGRNTSFAQGYDDAQPKALAQAITSQTQETPAQEALRSKDPALAAAFKLGDDRGKNEGTKDGNKSGDNAQVEQEAYRAGFAEGEAKVYSDFDRSHRPLGRAEREKEILESKPSEIKAIDVESDPVAWEPRTPHSFSLIRKAYAADRLGEISPDKIPRVSFQYRAQPGAFEHPDFDGAYLTLYNAEYEKAYLGAYAISYQQAFVTAHAGAYTPAKNQAALLVETIGGNEVSRFPKELNEGVARGTQAGLFEGMGYNRGRSVGFEEGKRAGELAARTRGLEAGRKDGYSKNEVAAKGKALKEGRADAESDYTNHVKVQWVANTSKLMDSDGDGKFQFGENVTLSASLRNFGGVRAEKGTLSLQIDPASVKGISLPKMNIRLPELEKNVQGNYVKLLTGTVQTGSEIRFTAKLYHEAGYIGEVTVKEAIYSPFFIQFSDASNPRAPLFVRLVDGKSGFQNAVWISSLGDKAIINDITLSIEPGTNSPVLVTWGNGVSGKTFVPPTDTAPAGYKRKNFFLSAVRREGLDTNKIRVILKNKAGQVVLDKEIEAPVKVTP
jgi:hypothetical protein